MDTTAWSPFGDLLRRHRLAAGLSQSELARRAALSRRGLTYLERGLRRPHADTVGRLAAALELRPGQRAAFEAAARGRPQARAHGPGSVHWLAEPLTSSIGREQEQKALAGVLLRDDVRLYTLTGPGGVGKTRLALRLAAGHGADFPDGVLTVGLAAIRSPSRSRCSSRAVPRSPGATTSRRQSAADLVVSERTVESHVTNILGKLGLTSRSQIAAWIVGRGLLKDDLPEPAAPLRMARRRGPS